MSQHLRALALATWTLVGATSTACPGPGASSRTATKTNAVVVIHSDVADAELWVDDRFIAHLGSLPAGIRLSPGSHRIEIRHDDYHTHFQEITVEPRQQLNLTLDLAPVLP